MEKKYRKRGITVMDKWDARFMELAWVISNWASCFRKGRKIGCVIVKNKRIVTTGYNGAPAGIKTCVERGECLRNKRGIESGTHAELCYAIHAEQNAIIAAPREQMLGATLYMCCIDPVSHEVVGGTCSCAMCKRMIINAGIETVVVREDKENYTVYPVQSWIDNDDSLTGEFGY